MPESDCLQILLSHDRWATAQILDCCGTLTADQFQRRFEIGPGSLHDTLTHIVGAMRTWTDTLAGAEVRPRLETDGQRRAPGQIRMLLDETWRAFSAEGCRLPLEDMTCRTTRSGQIVRLTRCALIVHVATHGMHHRAQCLNMLRQLGVKPLPPSSVVEWTRLSDAPP